MAAIHALVGDVIGIYRSQLFVGAEGAHTGA
jgi:hypothetical protein